MLTTSRDIVPLKEILDLFSPTCTLAHLPKIVHLAGLFQLQVHADNFLAYTLPQTFRIYPIPSAHNTVVQNMPYFNRCTQGTILFRNISKSLATSILSNKSLPRSMVAQKESKRKGKKHLIFNHRVRNMQSVFAADIQQKYLNS
jgi:hypothetical protein